MLDALSKGLYTYGNCQRSEAKRQVYFKHALKSALKSSDDIVSGWFASLLAGAFFVEKIFNWKGIGSVTIHALETSDLPIIMGSIVFIACHICVSSTLLLTYYIPF